ncbi:hypothetical protein PAEVO_03900 [Paenibacillus sp. GM2FR]|uniref:hypothetical protein n=1 Tax=Paenibacillus sp. GM2FR TaxID=2059268 RepID=UPI000C27FA61|nr:hypothetical protein [Paenibacillus sp. GM2FR]PJN53669.1 hypothetical protein PAEVO_03900 [Paenibacillus sp. GM2FR]
MTSDNAVKDYAAHNGPSVEEWEVIGARARVTLHTEISSISNHGNFIIKNDEKDLMSLDLMELTNTDSHNDNVGGEVEMMDLIGEKLCNLPNAKEVYCYPAGNDHVFLVVFEEDRDDLSNLIAEVQLDLLDAYPDEYFEIRYSILNRFSVDSLPKNAKQILERA